jgi:hypothetical protein
MAFWSDGKAKEPKRGFRWILIMDGIETYTVKKVSKPSFSITESTHQYINHTYYYPGRVEWQTISLTLVDPVNPDAAQSLVEIIRDSGYAPAATEEDYKTMSKSKSTGVLGEPIIRQIDSDGAMIEEWTLKNAWIKDVKFGDLDYSSDDLTEIEVEIRYDSASIATANAGAKGSSRNWV